MTLRRRRNIDDRACCVCLDYSASPENVLVHCEGACKMVVHQRCYGIDNVPAGVAWKCDRCSCYRHRVAKIKCCLCPIAGGALKPAEDGSWCHVICARFVPAVFVKDWLMSQISLTQVGIVKKTQSLAQMRCSICVRSGSYVQAKLGVCIRCHNEDCCVKFHAYCALKNELLVELDSTTNAVQHKSSCVAYCATHYRAAIDAHVQSGTLVRRYQYDSPLPREIGLPPSSASLGLSTNESADVLKPFDVKTNLDNSALERNLALPVAKRHKASANGVAHPKKRRLVAKLRLKQPNITNERSSTVTNMDQSVQRSVQTVILRKVGRTWHRVGFGPLSKIGAESTPHAAQKQDCYQTVKDSVEVVADIKSDQNPPPDETAITVTTSTSEIKFLQSAEVTSESSTLSGASFNDNPLLRCATPLDASDSISLLPYLPTSMLHPYIPVSLYENWKSDQCGVNAVPLVNSSYSIPSDTYSNSTAQQRVPDGAYDQEDSPQMPSSSTRCGVGLDSSSSLEVIHNDDELLARLDALINSECDWDTLHAHEFVIAKTFIERVLTAYVHDLEQDPTGADSYYQNLHSIRLHTESQHVRLTFYELLVFLNKKDELNDILYRESVALDQQYHELLEAEAIVRSKLLRPYLKDTKIYDELESSNG